MFIYVIENYSATKRDELLRSATWMNLKDKYTGYTYKVLEQAKLIW